MTVPNDLGGELMDDSTPGQAPYGLQPNGQILYTIAWHSNNPDTPGISSTIEGGIGFHVNINTPPDGSEHQQGNMIAFSAAPAGGEPPYSYSWHSSIDGDLGTGETLSISTLSPGGHTITVLGTDGAQRNDDDSIAIIIKETDTPVESDCYLEMSVSSFSPGAALRTDSAIMLPLHVGPVFSLQGDMLIAAAASGQPAGAPYVRILHVKPDGGISTIARLADASDTHQILNMFAAGIDRVCVVAGNPSGAERCILFFETPFRLASICDFTLH